MHIATATGIPTFGIFEPTDYKRTAPFGKKCYIIKTGLGCQPCYDVERKFHCSKKDIECLTRLTPEYIFEKIKNKINLT